MINAKLVEQHFDRFLKKFDLNNDGEVSPKEIFNAFLQEMDGDELKASDAAAILISTIDTNKDGKISRFELAKYSCKEAQRMLIENRSLDSFIAAESFLLRYDKDKNQKLDKSEFSQYFKGDDSYSPESIEYIFKSSDQDNDGFISPRELEDWFQNNRRFIKLASRPNV